MNATLGQILVLLGLAFATSAAVVGLWSGFKRRDDLLHITQWSIYGFSASMLLANAVMIKSLLQHDFSVKYVAQVGSKATPTIFTVVSLWSALEGSILFWGAIMGAYLFAFTFWHRKEHAKYMQFSLGMMASVAIFFALLIAGPANPWAPGPFPIPLDGPGPNPLLQNHPLMIIHPPMLYMGYVGMVLPFGIATGALLRGELGDAWLVPLRKWTLIPWMFLTIGIILGSWWAYAVLGWGGYWAWDPVENASFMPWLAATAFIHSTMVLERKKSLKLWTLALALGAFVLTLIGTFMTRSGVFNSVHSFTQSSIGPWFLVFIALVCVVSIILLAIRGPLLVAETQIEHLLSREGSILMNNLVFVAITFTVFLGTIFPLVTEAISQKRISVGEPYFNKMALPLGLLMLFMMGVGPMLPWGNADKKTLQRQFLIPAGVGVAVSLICLALGFRGFMPLMTFGIAAYVTTVTLRELALPARQRMIEHRESAFQAFARSASRANRRFGGYVVHLGIVMVIVAIAASSSYKVHNSGTIAKGKSLPIGAYQVRFDGLGYGRDPHREWTAANITLIHPNGKEVVAHDREAPRMNFYERSTDPVGSPSVNSQVFQDVYVSLIAFDKANNSATFNLWVFPLVGWIWYAIPVLVLGALISLWPQRKLLKSSGASS